MENKINYYATKSGKKIRLTAGAMSDYKGDNHVTIDVKDGDIIITSQGYDATISKDGAGGQFGITKKLEKLIYVAPKRHMKVSVSEDKIIIHTNKYV